MSKRINFLNVLWILGAAILIIMVVPGRPQAGQTLKPGDIQVSGAINKTFTPIGSDAGVLGDKVIINLHEKTVGGVSLALPPGTKPGTYVIGDHYRKPVVDFSGEYDVFGPNHAFYLSTAGSLVLTFTGSKYSGYFRFQAVHNKDASKSIWVIGSFTDVPFKSN